MDENKLLPRLSQNLLEILEDNEYYDITIEVERILSTNKKKIDGTLTHIKLPNILPEIFQIILRYIYGGKISLVEYDILDIIRILVAAIELSLLDLIPHIQSFLIENKENWIEQNFNLIYQMSYENGSFLDLQKFCTELISKHSKKIFNSSDFTSIPEKALISLIQHNNHQISEVQVWKHVLKWGIARNPGLSSDPSSYSNDDFNALKNTLQQCIPFMKFYNLTSREFLNNVFPYREILPNELYIDLLKLFLSNNYRPSTKKIIDSKIITVQHTELISKWIDRLDIKDELKNSYKFQLILRGSRDGFTAKRFHEICDNRSRTITIIKVKGSDEILGGYNPIEWANKNNFYGHVTNRDSFIFSFLNKKNFKNHIVFSRVSNEKYAISHWNKYGPSFGNGDLTIFGGHETEDFFSNKTSYCYKSSYENQIRKSNEYFSVEEYEIFQIINE